MRYILVTIDSETNEKDIDNEIVLLDGILILVHKFNPHTTIRLFETDLPRIRVIDKFDELYTCLSLMTKKIDEYIRKNNTDGILKTIKYIYARKDWVKNESKRE